MALGKYVLGGIGAGAAYVALPMAHTAQTYPIPASVAIERLQAARRVVEGTGLGSLTLSSPGSDKGTVLIKITAAGKPGSVICRALVNPATPTTSSADVDCSQPAGKDQALRQVAANAMAIVIREHVAATIEDRRYDIDGVADRMLAFVVMNRPAIAKSLASEIPAESTKPPSSGLH